MNQVYDYFLKTISFKCLLQLCFTGSSLKLPFSTTPSSISSGIWQLTQVIFEFQYLNGSWLIHADLGLYVAPKEAI